MNGLSKLVYSIYRTWLDFFCKIFKPKYQSVEKWIVSFYRSDIYLLQCKIGLMTFSSEQARAKIVVALRQCLLWLWCSLWRSPNDNRWKLLKICGLHLWCHFEVWTWNLGRRAEYSDTWTHIQKVVRYLFLGSEDEPQHRCSKGPSTYDVGLVQA